MRTWRCTFKYIRCCWRLLANVARLTEVSSKALRGPRLFRGGELDFPPAAHSGPGLAPRAPLAGTNPESASRTCCARQTASAAASNSQCCTRRTGAKALFRTDGRDNGHTALRRPDERMHGVVHHRGVAGSVRRREEIAPLMAVWGSDMHVRAAGHWPRAECAALSARPLAARMDGTMGRRVMRPRGRDSRREGARTAPIGRSVHPSMARAPSLRDR